MVNGENNGDFIPLAAHNSDAIDVISPFSVRYFVLPPRSDPAKINLPPHLEQKLNASPDTGFYVGTYKDPKQKSLPMVIKDARKGWAVEEGRTLPEPSSDSDGGFLPTGGATRRQIRRRRRASHANGRRANRSSRRRAPDDTSDSDREEDLRLARIGHDSSDSGGVFYLDEELASLANREMCELYPTDPDNLHVPVAGPAHSPEQYEALFPEGRHRRSGNMRVDPRELKTLHSRNRAAREAAIGKNRLDVLLLSGIWQRAKAVADHACLANPREISAGALAAIQIWATEEGDTLSEEEDEISDQGRSRRWPGVHVALSEGAARHGTPPKTLNDAKQSLLIMAAPLSWPREAGREMGAVMPPLPPSAAVASWLETGEWRLGHEQG